MQHKLATLKQSLSNHSQTLHAVSPLATLNRGYALVIKKASGQLIRSTKQLKPDDIIETRLAEGRFTSQVKSLN